jgi:hypothetical protein
METNALYYTFSTIAQALAGGFGILAAFALFRLSAIAKDVADAQQAVRGLKSPFDPAWDKFKKLGTDEFLRSELPSAGLTDADSRVAQLRRGQVALRAMPVLRRRMATALVLTVVDIAFSIGAIPFVPQLATSCGWSTVIVTLAVLLAIISLGIFAWLVRAITEPQW